MPTPALPNSLSVRVAVGLFAVVAAGLVVGRLFGWVTFTWLEIAGSITGAACVLLVVARSVWNFPIGIVSCIAYMVFFYDGKLFAEAGLQVLFILLGVQGWIAWAWGKTAEIHARRVPLGELTILAVVFPLGWFGLTKLLEYLGGAAPMMDAFVTTLSITSQWMLNRRYIENWLGWIVVDQVSVFLFWSREMYLTAGLYAVFLAMCAAGFLEWRRSLNRGAA